MNIEISKELDDYMHEFVLRVVNEVGPRMPCSPQEAKAAQIIKEEFEKTCDNVVIEPFTCHPRAFLGWIKLDVIMVFVSIILYLIISVETVVLVGKQTILFQKTRVDQMIYQTYNHCNGKQTFKKAINLIFWIEKYIIYF